MCQLSKGIRRGGGGGGIQDNAGQSREMNRSNLERG